MTAREAREIFQGFFGVDPEHPDVQNLIDQRLNDPTVLWRALTAPDRDSYTDSIAQVWTAIYTLGIRQRPVAAVS